MQPSKTPLSATGGPTRLPGPTGSSFPVVCEGQQHQQEACRCRHSSLGIQACSEAVEQSASHRAEAAKSPHPSLGASRNRLFRYRYPPLPPHPANNEIPGCHTPGHRYLECNHDDMVPVSLLPGRQHGTTSRSQQVLLDTVVPSQGHIRGTRERLTPENAGTRWVTKAPELRAIWDVSLVMNGVGF